MIKFLLIIMLIWLLMYFLLYKVECLLIYHPKKINNLLLKNNQVDELNKNVKQKFGSKTYVKEFNIPTNDNETINGLLYKSYINDKIIIYAHGNAGNIYDRTNIIYQFGHLASIVLFDYRGFGLSSGIPTDKGLKTDIFAVWDYVLKLGYKPNNIILYGESLGCSFVSWLGKKLVSYYDDNNNLPKTIIMQSGFYNLSKITSDLYSKFLAFFIQSKLDNYNNIINIKNKIPVLIVHSKMDEMINFKHAETLMNDCFKNTIQNIKLHIINGYHNDPQYDNQFMITITNLINP